MKWETAQIVKPVAQYFNKVTEMSTCTRCESLPDEYPSQGILYVFPAIVPSVLALRHYLQQTSIEHSEVVESDSVTDINTAGEHQWPVRNGADLAQGFLFGRPNAAPRPA